MLLRCGGAAPNKNVRKGVDFKMIKKLCALFLAGLLILSLASCGQESEADNTSSTAPDAASDTPISIDAINSFDGYGEHADLLMESLKKDFWMIGQNKMGEKVKSNTPITLWGYAAYMEAAGLRFELHPDDEAVKEEYLKALNSVEEYRCKWRGDDLQVYQCWAGESQAECFYDDDVWVVLEFINAYNLFEDEHWLSQAKGTIEFCYSGWDDKCGGGVYWKEDTKAEKNTCINAPLALASCQLYNVTGDKYYLDWAVKLYDWTKTTFLDESDNTFWDNINVESGNVVKDKYTYNTGNMIGAAAALYSATGEASYLEDAKAYAEGAYKRFGGFAKPARMDSEIYICDSNSWFGGSLLKGYLLLAKADPSADTKYIDSYAQSLAYAVSISIDNRGYIKSGWVESGIMTTNDISLLDQSGNARLLLQLQLWKNSH